MDFDLTFSIIGRLLLAGALGALIGIERALAHKAAGMRTNMFICLGSCMFTIISNEYSLRYGGDNARIVAQLIPGIGFIGAGAIIRERGSVVGLTTAATIFIIASVGMAIGTGMYVTALFLSVLIVAGLSALGWLEKIIVPRTRLMTFRITTPNLEGVMSASTNALEEMKLSMQNFQVLRIGSDFVMEFDADVSAHQVQKLGEKLSPLGSRYEAVPHDAPRE